MRWAEYTPVIGACQPEKAMKMKKIKKVFSLEFFGHDFSFKFTVFSFQFFRHDLHDWHDLLGGISLNI